MFGGRPTQERVIYDVFTSNVSNIIFTLDDVKFYTELNLDDTSDEFELNCNAEGNANVISMDWKALDNQLMGQRISFAGGSDTTKAYSRGARYTNDTGFLETIDDEQQILLFQYSG